MNNSKTRIVSDSISLPFTVDSSEAIEIAKRKIKKSIGNSSDYCYSIFRRSVDARKKDDIRFVYTVLAETGRVLKEEEMASLLRIGFRVCPDQSIEYVFGGEKSEYRPIVVGSGPAGMFCALMLAEQGYKPILIERGDCIEKRVATVDSFFNGDDLNVESNVMFGAGGAGTFSDGKLVTRINDPLCGYVFSRLCDFGAPREINLQAKPHIGTDLLQNVVERLIKRIEECGGDVIYNCRLDSVSEISDGVVAHTSIADFSGSCIVLAIGHSARDTYKYLNDKGYSLIAKPFSVGVRIEHLRSDIEYALYGKFAGDPRLGAAEYALSDTRSGRGVYTFCMCPGGEVIAAASEHGGLVVNGMSHHARDGVNSNAAVAVSVSPNDYDGTPLGAIDFQRKLENKAFALGGGSYTAPIELLGDYLSGKAKNLALPKRINPTYTRHKTNISNLSEVFPEFVNEELKRGFISFGKKIKGFDSPDAVMTAVESRTSAPIRILRNEAREAYGHSRIYPCGEGAGYAGGITSAAIDGIKTALEIMKKFAP